MIPEEGQTLCVFDDEEKLFNDEKVALLSLIFQPWFLASTHWSPRVSRVADLNSIMDA